MKTFLESVAQSLLQKYGSDLHNLTVVFPGKRAGLFLNQALAELSPTPVWAPRYQTISELFQQSSSFSLADPVESVCRLYRAYARHVPEPQSLDRFWSWGEILLADFDDLDKHMVDAAALFRNIADLRELEDNSYITAEQEEALKAFFSNFSLEENSQLKEQFLRLWNHMGEIYRTLQQDLRQAGMLYEGALQRDLVELLLQARKSGQETSHFPCAMTYAFVGFNVLNDVEQALFDELQARHQALFYWDYDRHYIGADHEAGHFMRRNLQRYGNELTEECFDNLRQPKQWHFVTASSENAQARYIPQWLKTELLPRENRTAVVLCNEQLLQPVLHSLPTAGSPAAVNVTMGFPLSDTPVYSFLMALVVMQTDGYDPGRRRFRPSLLQPVERHPFTRLLSRELWLRPAPGGSGLLDYLLEILSALAPHFREGDTIYRQLYAEALFKAFTTVSRLCDLADSELLNVDDHTLRRILRSVLQQQNIPFHGEPATGLQVLGVLETRALDFQHLLLLSVGEGYLPRTVSDTSLIPYSLRESFGLTTVRHKMAVYAYYFYRLIQRASHVTFVYNESSAGPRQNEPSRFLRQLLAETDFPVEYHRLQAASQVAEVQSIVVEKTPEIMRQLRDAYDQNAHPDGRSRILSPTAINSYTQCPMIFYYRYVRGIQVESDAADGLDARLFGDIFHRAAELLYMQLTSAGKVIRRQDIEPLLDHGGQPLQPFIRQAFRDKFFHEQPEDYSGILIIAERVVETYLKNLLRHDLRLTPFTLVGTEQWVDMTLDIGKLQVRTGGIIDRLDQVSDPEVEGGVALRVVDYKTGGSPDALPRLEQLFAQSGQREHYYLQAILYATIVATHRGTPVTPCLFYVHRAGGEDYSPKLKVARQLLNDVRPLQAEFLEGLCTVIAEIFNSEIPFTQTTSSCNHCDYSHLCGR